MQTLSIPNNQGKIFVIIGEVSSLSLFRPQLDFLGLIELAGLTLELFRFGVSGGRFCISAVIPTVD